MKRILLLAGACLLAHSMAFGAAPIPQQSAQAAGFYRARLGAFEVVALSDGTAARHIDAILSDPATTRAELLADHLAEPVPLSINAYLINTNAHLVLVDTGAGELFGASSGHLLQNIAAAGYRPEQIDTILLTHIHGDHSGGLSIGGKRQFPNATVYVGAADAAYWLSKEEEAKAPAAARKTFIQSQATVNPYVDAGRLVPISGDGQVVPGISARAAPGHTPGHTAFVVTSEGHSLLLWGDIIHCAEIQFGRPAITSAYDVDPARAAATRAQLFAFADAEGMVVASPHISFPGFGHVRKTGAGYAWLPLPYTDRVAEMDIKP